MTHDMTKQQIENQIKKISCPLENYFAGGMVAKCPNKITDKIEIHNDDDIYSIGISSGSAVLAAENNGKLKKKNNFPVAVGVVKDFFLDGENFSIVIENLQLSKDILIPEQLGEIVAQFHGK